MRGDGGKPGQWQHQKCFTGVAFRSLLSTLHGQKYVNSCSSNISFQNHGHQYGFGPQFAAITASTLLGRLFTRCWNIAVGTCCARPHKSISEALADEAWHSNSSHRCLMGLRSGLCAGQVKFIHTDIDKLFMYCMDLALSC